MTKDYIVKLSTDKPYPPVLGKPLNISIYTDGINLMS